MINSNSSINETTSKISTNQLVDSTNDSKSYSSTGGINTSQNPLNNASKINTAGLNQQNPAVPKKEEPGIFGRFANYLKSFWETEEEEYIDAHGFVSKRPKKKIPLRNKGASEPSDVQTEGANGLNYATQHSGFGRMFL